jgi:hypothetical protein
MRHHVVVFEPLHQASVGITTGVKLRGPERSEGHVSFNFQVRQLPCNHRLSIPLMPIVVATGVLGGYLRAKTGGLYIPQGPMSGCHCRESLRTHTGASLSATRLRLAFPAPGSALARALTRSGLSLSSARPTGSLLCS